MGKIEQRIDDKQGRITLDQHLLNYAGLNRDIVAIGVGQYWRLVSPELANK
jgi:DNA-binding transcriptional regulator/RsmH inhibitor MraZ